MGNLIRLEMKKFDCKEIIKGGTITNFVILILFMIVLVGSVMDNDMAVKNYDELIRLVDTVVKPAIIIFSSILLAKVTVEEYKDKTIQLMFMYPINRRMLFMSKIIIIMIFTLFNIFLSNMLMLLIISSIDNFINIVPGSFSLSVIQSNISYIVYNAIAGSGMVLFSLYFGMKYKSLASTIIPAVLISTFISSSSGSGTLSDNIPVILMLGLTGLLVGIFTFRNIENKDVL